MRGFGVLKGGVEGERVAGEQVGGKVTDAFGNTLAGQTVSVLGGNGATTAPTVITGPDGTVESSVTSQTAGISTVTATINSSSRSGNGTFTPMSGTAKTRGWGGPGKTPERELWGGGVF
ncbi:Ig-like domain-containing protein [Escherichia coli]